jgi:hypothetical protein
MSKFYKVISNIASSKNTNCGSHSCPIGMIVEEVRTKLRPDSKIINCISIEDDKIEGFDIDLRDLKEVNIKRHIDISDVYLVSDDADLHFTLQAFKANDESYFSLIQQPRNLYARNNFLGSFACLSMLIEAAEKFIKTNK